MSRLLGTAALTVASLWIAAGHAAAAIQIEVTPAFAPNATVNSSFADWVTNAIAYLETGVGGAGPRVVASDYEVAGPFVQPHEIVVTPFNSWRGQADPTPGWDGVIAQFEEEKGNRIHFGVRIWTDSPGDMKFSLEDVFFELDSNDPQDTFDFPEAGNPLPSLTGNYRAALVGIDYGPDGMRGGGDDIRYDGSNPAPGSTLVNEIIYVGAGTAFDATGFPGANNQQIIDSMLSQIESLPFTLAAAYEVVKGGNPVARGVGSVVIVPEPTGLLLAGLPLLGLIGRARRRRS